MEFCVRDKWIVEISLGWMLVKELDLRGRAWAVSGLEGGFLGWRVGVFCWCVVLLWYMFFFCFRR